MVFDPFSKHNLVAFQPLDPFFIGSDHRRVCRFYNPIQHTFDLSLDLFELFNHCLLGDVRFRQMHIPSVDEHLLCEREEALGRLHVFQNV
ncbi:hypothetical protein [Pseudooceanicola antarcticus]|uniref:hypothetical protein n=1 Tax=Pseudooceanicola antarcticus TaxID=1247613 RepID=UPI0018E1CE73|nr:hypothetical protein [Pseudooceanicola antarcticus]